jgi:hypothetical protein
LHPSTPHLLKRLEPAVRPATAPPGTTRPKAPIESQSFEQLLGRARAGAIHSGRQVQVAAELQPPLDAAQLERLSDAADQAEAIGATRALLLLDGRALVLDVANRTIVSELNDATAVPGIDAAVRVGAMATEPPALHPPPKGVLPPAMLKHLIHADPPK